VPDLNDIEKIEKMLKDVGETELEIGQIAEESVEERADGTLEEAEQVVPPEEIPQVAEGGDENELMDLLKDIEIGLSEERELEAKFHEGEVEEEEKGGEPIEEEEPSIPLSEEDVVKEQVEEPSPALPEEGVISEEEMLEEGFDLPADFDMSKIGVDEEPPVDILRRAEGIEETKEEEQPPIKVEKEEVAEAEVQEVEEEIETIDELMAEPQVQKVEEEIESIEGITAEPPAEEGGEVETGEEVSEPFIEEFEMPELEELESLEEVAEHPAGEEAAEEPELVAEKPFEIELEEELPPLTEEGEPVSVQEEEVSEAEIGIEEAPEPTFEIEEELSELAREIEEPLPSVEEAAPRISEEEREEEREAEPEIELSDEDIILIKTKLKQLSPAVASVVRDLIVNVSIPPAHMTGLLRLLIRDEPESEIIRYIEKVTGRRIVPVRKPVEIPLPAVKKGRFALVAENLGALIRIAGLFLTILVVLGTIFMVFFYRPIKSGRYYREGIEYLRRENYTESERIFQKAVSIYEKVSEYDIYGWEYMLAGNYDAAEQKFKHGIEIDTALKDLSLRENLAQLYNILRKYDEADALYDILLSVKPGYYHYQKLKGRNLIDWGREDEARLDEAYSLFREAYGENKRNSDPLFQLLSIDILTKNEENVNYLYGVLTERYPQDVDRDVYTDLASFYITIKYLDPVWDIISSVIQRYPDSPKAYYVFSLYNKEINNKAHEEGLLKLAIQYENKRELRYPWETRDRELLSNAYNNLGEIYARMEVPGKTAEAVSYFKEAISINEENTQAYFNLGQTYFYQEKNYDLARRYYERARARGFENDDLKYNLGLLYYYRRDFEKALRQWSRLEEIIPDNANVRFAIGSAFLHMGKYNAALGEFLMLAEAYEGLVESLGDIKPWSAYHKRIVLGAASVYNNLGVSYQKLFETTGNPAYQKDSLVYLYKAGELADIIGTERGIIQYNINYIIHPNVIRADMAVNDDISQDYRFVTR